MTQDEFKQLKKICITTHIEVLHLKKLLTNKGLIEDNNNDFVESLQDYIDELDNKSIEYGKLIPDE